jgi:TnpA family transposase
MTKDATVSIRLPAELRKIIAAHAAANHRTLGSQVLYYIEQGMDKPKTVAKRTSGVQKPDDVSDQVWDDFCKLRASKKAPLTESALQNIKTQANLAMWTLENALAETCARGWTSFKAEWVQHKASKQQALEASNRQAAEAFING